ncbi:Methanogenesis regulatory histidine kinase FilI [uncultured archaeon]|nr:Methanogenesis regulatory histidine kinase FilI [uncultured archaeon]
MRDETGSKQNGDLRLQAETLLKDRKRKSFDSTKEADRDIKALVHELQVHQIELEMQNEEMKRAKQEIEDALAKYSDLYDFAPIGLFTIDIRRLIQEVNLAGAKLLGVARSDLMNKHFYLFVQPKDLSSFNRFCKSAFETSTKQTCELNILRDEEPTGYVRIEGMAAEDDQKCRQLQIAVIDITEPKRMEKDLREIQDYLENLIDYANAPIIVWDASLHITRFNHAFERLTSLEAHDVLGESLEVLFPERTKEESLEYIRRTQSGERWDAVEIPILRTDGSVRTVLWSSANIHNKDGTIATIAQGQDITERKIAEEELKKARDDLELKVTERTAELQDALEAAKESVEAKSAFLANMSHKLRTPMNAVIGFSSLLMDDSLTPEQKEYIEGIRKGGEALLAIIDDILDYSRAEKDKIELEHQPFSLKYLIDESLDMVATQASKKGLNLSETINYGTPDTIIGDHGRLRQILVNLLTNAVKFTDKGDVSVSVSSKTIEGDRHQIFFEVKDTGIGIPQDKISQIFEPFVQVERTLSRKRDGVGLGLAITKNLVELMGGKIWVESIPGQGTTFSFMIPAEIIPGKRLDFGKMDSRVTSENFAGLKPMRILVAEDNPSNQKVLVEMLKRMGYRPDAVADGREVVQSLERQDYDLVFMDIKMPEMDGITAAKVIRNLRPENGPKIVAITAFALEGDRERCLEAGMDDYISKPIKFNELRTVLERCL